MILSSFLAILSSAIRMGIPLAFAALGGVYSSKAGITALGLEGMMLSGSFSAAYFSYISGNPWLGLAGAALVGGLIALLEAVLIVKQRVDQVIGGIGINLLALGGTNLLLQVVVSLAADAPLDSDSGLRHGVGSVIPAVCGRSAQRLAASPHTLWPAPSCGRGKPAGNAVDRCKQRCDQADRHADMRNAGRNCRCLPEHRQSEYFLKKYHSRSRLHCDVDHHSGELSTKRRALGQLAVRLRRCASNLAAANGNIRPTAQSGAVSSDAAGHYGRRRASPCASIFRNQREGRIGGAYVAAMCKRIG